ncbi:MAG: hypothetical protein ACRDFB_02310 [Rhabdochlamydiaceae bacterium]
MVIGHDDFDTGRTIHDVVSSSVLYSPDGIAFDKSGNLWIAGMGLNRLLEFLPPFSNGINASLVLGQANFAGMHAGTSANMLAKSYDVKVDNNGNLWVADTDNNRVLEFATPSVPEFGPVVLTVLTLSTFSIIIISAKTKLQFPQF